MNSVLSTKMLLLQLHMMLLLNFGKFLKILAVIWMILLQLWVDTLIKLTCLLSIIQLIRSLPQLLLIILLKFGTWLKPQIIIQLLELVNNIIHLIGTQMEVLWLLQIKINKLKLLIQEPKRSCKNSKELMEVKLKRVFG